MSKVVVFGTGDWADMAYVYLTHDSPHEVVAFTVDRQYLTAEHHHGRPVVPFEEVTDAFTPGEYDLFLPISYTGMNRLRATKYDQAKAWGYRCVSYISSKAITWPGFMCGENCFILEGTIIQPFVQIGHDVVILGGSHLGHHTVVKDHVTITCQVGIAGRCTIEPYCFLGINSTVRDHTTVTAGTLVGAGGVVLNDTKEWQVYKAQQAGPQGIRSDELRTI